MLLSTWGSQSSFFASQHNWSINPVMAKAAILTLSVWISVAIGVMKVDSQQMTSYGAFGSGTSNCACPLDYRPVCSSTGKTYTNACLLRCEQAYNPGMYQASEGACGTIAGVYGPFSPSASGISGSTYNFGTGVGGGGGSASLYGGQPTYPGAPSPMYGPLTANAQSSCSWSCPTLPQSPYGAPGLSSGQYNGNNYPYVAGYTGSASSYPAGSANPYGESTYAYGSAGVGSSGVYYGGASTYGGSTTSQVCDTRGGVHLGECQYYRALCETEKRGGMMAKIPCSISVNGAAGLYNSPPYGRNSVRMADEPASTKSPIGG